MLFQYAKNWTYLSFYDLFAPLLFVIVLTYVLLAFVNLILRDGMKTSVIISFFLIMFFSYGHIYESIKTARIFNHEITHGILIGVCFCVFAVFIFFIMLLSNTRAYFERYMKIFSVLLLLLISFNLGQAVLSDIGELIADVNNDNIVVSNTEKNRAENNVRPDIYYIILDSYSGDLALKEFFDFDNGEFVAWLKNNGFKLPRRSWSNYCQTAQSLSSSLNMDYINKLFDLNGLKDSTDRSLYKRLIGKNALTRFLKTRGYTIVKFIYGYVITDSFEADITDQEQGVFFLHEFTNSFANTTMLIGFKTYVESASSMIIDVRRIMAMIEGLPVVPTKFKSPKFVFAHIICPHPPFVFDKNGPTMKYGNLSPAADSDPEYKEKKSIYREAYLGQVEFLNKHIRTTIRRIIRNSKTPPVVILQADHGSGMSYYVDLNKTNLRDRFSILNAYYLPYGGDKAIYEGITPVNTFRCILNYYFGTKLDRLPDKSYFTSGDKPFEFFEVTDKLNPKP